MSIHFQERPKELPLTVNRDLAHYKVIGKSRNEGERDLYELTKTSDVEEGWAFIEGKDKLGKPVSLWYEVGERETEVSVGRGDYHPLDDLKAMGITPEKYSCYHIHPAGNVSPIDYEFGKLFSSRDFLSAMLFAPYYLNQKIEYDSRIVVVSGIWCIRSESDIADTDANKISRNYGAFINHDCGNERSLPTHFLGSIPVLGILFPRKYCSPHNIIQRFSNQDVEIEFAQL